MGLIAWFQKQREWRRDHIASFTAEMQRQPDGLTLFQHSALTAIARFVPHDQFKHHPMEKEDGVYLLAPLGSEEFELYIYPNEAGIFGAKPHVSLEEWDYRTPTDLLQALIKECASRVA